VFPRHTPHCSSRLLDLTVMSWFNRMFGGSAPPPLIRIDAYMLIPDPNYTKKRNNKQAEYKHSDYDKENGDVWGSEERDRAHANKHGLLHGIPISEMRGNDPVYGRGASSNHASDHPLMLGQGDLPPGPGGDPSMRFLNQPDPRDGPSMRFENQRGSREHHSGYGRHRSSHHRSSHHGSGRDGVSAHNFANPAPNHPPPPLQQQTAPRPGKLPEGATLPTGVSDPFAKTSMKPKGVYGEREHQPGMTMMDINKFGKPDDPQAQWRLYEELQKNKEKNERNGGGGGGGKDGRSGGGSGGGRKDQRRSVRDSGHGQRRR
jgi:hypothetical protein